MRENDSIPKPLTGCILAVGEAESLSYVAQERGSTNGMIQQYLIQYGYALVFFGTAVEGDGTLLAAAFLAHRGYFRFVVVVFLGAASTTLANQVYFWVSRTHGKALVDRMASQDPRYARLENWVRRRGVVLLLISRFLYGLRTAIPAVCGVVEMPPSVFFVTNLAGAILWSGLLGSVGYLGGDVVGLLLADIRRHEWYVALVLLLGSLGAILWKSHGNDLRGAFEALFYPDKLGVDSASLMVRRQDKAKGVFARIAKDL